MRQPHKTKTVSNNFMSDPGKIASIKGCKGPGRRRKKLILEQMSTIVLLEFLNALMVILMY
jgi:hypothetical protein